MGKFLTGCRIAISGDYRDWTPTQISKWINANGGTYHAKITADTTHLVVTKEAWREQSKRITNVYEIDRNYGIDIKIVSFDWLDDCFTDGTKKRESSYLWEKIDPRSKKQEKVTRSKHRREQREEQENESSSRRNGPSTMAEVFYNSTDSFVPEREKKEIERKIELERQAQMEIEAEERAEREKEAALNKTAASFKKGSKKARNEIFAENHHVYSDETNFKYDVLLTKVDTRHNKNERWALTVSDTPDLTSNTTPSEPTKPNRTDTLRLQIYESNSEPYTYAMNAQFASTRNKPTNNILAAIGCNFPTAFRAFKKVFKEKTDVEWDDRIDHAIERNRREKLDRGRAIGSDVGTVRGVAVSESAAVAALAARAAVKKDEDFGTKPFSYHPPAYGSRGLLPSDEKLKETLSGANVNENGESAVDNERIEAWVGGANGSGPEESQNAASTQDPADAEQNYANVWAGIHAYTDPAEQTATGKFDFNPLEGVEDYQFSESMFTGQANDHTQAQTQQTSFEASASQEPDTMAWDPVDGPTQGIDETQEAMRAHAEFQDFMNRETASSMV